MPQRRKEELTPLLYLLALRHPPMELTNNQTFETLENWSNVTRKTRRNSRRAVQETVDGHGMPWSVTNSVQHETLEVRNRFEVLSMPEVPDFTENGPQTLIEFLDELNADPIFVQDEVDSEVSYWFASFRMPGHGNIRFTPSEQWAKFRCCGIHFCLNPEAEMLDFYEVDYWGLPSYENARGWCCRGNSYLWGYEITMAGQRRDEEERLAFEEALESNGKVFKEWQRCLDYDAAKHRVYPDHICRVRSQNCDRLVVCNECSSCVKHCRSVACCGEVARERQDPEILSLWGVLQPQKRKTTKIRSRGSRRNQFRHTFVQSLIRRILRDVGQKELAARASLFSVLPFSEESMLTGEAQAGWFNVGMEMPTSFEHVVRLPAFEELFSYFKQRGEEVTWTTLIRECGFFVYHIQQGGLTKSNVLVSAAQLVCNIGLPLLKELDWNRFFPNAQSDVDPMVLLGGALTGLLSVFAVVLVKHLPSDKSIDTLLSRMSQIGRVISSFEKVSEYSGIISQYCIEFIKTNVLGFASEDLQEWKDIDKFNDEVRALNTTDFEQRCTVDFSMAAQVNTLLQRADVIQKRLDALRIHPTAYVRFTKAHLFLIRARDICSQVGAGNMRARTAPLVIHVHGGTGVGKSSMLSYLNAHLLAALGSIDPADLQNKVYYRYPTSDFFDGFRNGCDIVVCDDFGSAKDSESHPSSEPLEQIRMTNTAPFRPPMAHLSDKANTVFEAKVIIWTSNRPTFAFPSLTNPEAVHNRVHLRFLQTVRPEFAKTKNINGIVSTVLDTHKVAEAAKTNPNAWRDCMVFQQQTTEGLPRADGTYESIDEALTFRQFAEVCVQELKKKQGIGAGMIEEERRYFQSCIPFGRAQAVFYRPGSLMKFIGHNTHVDVFQSLIDIAGSHELREHPDRAFEKRVPTYLELREKNIPACVEIDPDDEDAFLYALQEFYDDLIQGYSVDDALARLRTFFTKPCVEHIDHTTCARFWEKVVEVRHTFVNKTTEYWQKVKTGYQNLPASSRMIIELVGAQIAVVFLSALVGHALLWLLLPSQKVKAKKSGKSEQYNQAVKAAAAGKTEQYQNGVKAGATGNVERYTNDMKGVQTGKVEYAFAEQPRGEMVGDSESCTDQNANEVRRKAWHNTYLFSCKKAENSWLNLGTFTFIGGRVGITNRHIISMALQYEEGCLLSADGRKYSFKMSDLNVFHIPDSDDVHGKRDVAIVECPLHVLLHPDIRDFFMTAEDFSRHVELEKVSLIAHRVIDNKPRLALLETNMCKAWQHSLFSLRTPTETKQIRDYYTYALETQPGDCGGLVVAFDRRFNRKVVGIHMAGLDANTVYSGVATALTRECIDKLVAGLPLRWNHSLANGYVRVDNPIQVNAENGYLVHVGAIPGEFVHLGEANDRVFSSKVTAITPSVVAEVCGPILKKPALLTRIRTEEGVLIDPMENAIKKASTESRAIDPSALRCATHAVDQMINSQVREEDNRPLSFEEAVCGIAGNDFFPAINRSTSPGYGWKKVGKGKTAWLGVDEFKLDDPALLSEYNSALARLRNGQRCGKYWTDTLKDELRAVAKVDQGKTRLFAAGEMVQTILLRQFFMGFAAHMARNKIDFESCIGVNVYGMDWTRIARKLGELGPFVVAGDFTNYDGTLPADALWSVFEVVNNFYKLDARDTAEAEQIRYMLWCEIVNSVHINGNHVYMWSHSQPSGCPFTSVLNSVLHSIIVRVVYVLAARKYAPHLQSLNNFDRYVRHINYGDDDVTNISPEIIEWFNQETMAEMYATFGMTYTDELKTGTLAQAKTLEEVRFLKRAFVFDSQQARYRAPLELETILEMPCWNKTKGDKYALTKMVLEDAIYELAQHDRTVWDANYPKFEAARKIINARLPLRFPTWEELQFEDASKYFGFLKLEQNAVIGARNQSSNGSAQQILLASDSNPSGLLESGWERYLPLLANVCPPKTIGYLPDVWFSQSELTENSFFLEEGIENTQLNNDLNNNTCLALVSEGEQVFSHQGESQNGDEIMPGSMAPEAANNTLGAGTAGDFTVEDQEVTQFHHDGEVSNAIMPITRQTLGMQMNAEDMLVNSIRGFMARPVLLQQFEWPSGTGTIGTLFSLDLPTAWLSQRMIQEKLQGFRYLRCDLIIEVQVNAQPFNAGMAVMWFCPLLRQMNYKPSSTIHLGGITGYPHVFYRCGDETAVKMRIPFQANISHFDLVQADGTMGEVLFTVMSPLTGAANVDAAVWCWAENISLEMPTGVPLKLPAPVMSGPAQAGEESPESSISKQDGTARERKKAAGPVEVAMNVLGRVSTALSLVPVLTPFAGIASAAFGLGKSIASFFGWSKPLVQDSPMEVSFLYGKNMTNATGAIHAKVMALDSRNATDIPLEVSGTEEDEMAFATLLKRETYADFFAFESTSGQGTMLYKWPVHPASMKKSFRDVMIGGAMTRIVQAQPSLLAYLSETSAQWRGGIRYTFKAVKTPYHSGRLRITFAPGADETTDINTIDLQKCYSKVFDLRETSDMVFEVPFVSNNPFRTTKAFFPFPSPLDTVNLRKCYSVPTGMIYITVVNALRGPTTVAPAVEILLFIGVMDDFQFAIPEVDDVFKIISRANDVGTMSHSGTAQMGDVRSTIDLSDAPNRTTIGEAFTGFRQWMKRYTVFTPRGSGPWYCRPFDVSITVPNLTVDSTHPLDAWSLAWPLYRYVSGPVRFMFVLNDGTHNMNLSARPDVNLRVLTGTEPVQSHGGIFTATTSQERIMEYEVPFYQPFPAIATDNGDPKRDLGYAGTTDPADNYHCTPYTRGNILYTDLDPSNYSTYRATGESFNLGFQLGPPILFAIVGPTPP